MKSIKYIQNLLLISICIVLLDACKKEEEQPKPDTPTLPTSLAYSPNSFEVNQGIAGSSNAPNVTGGTQPITAYQITVSPTNANISINSQGVIAVNANSVVGDFVVSVGTTNAAGNKTFSNVFTVKVKTVVVGGTNVTFNADIKPLITANCGSCHNNFTVYQNAKNNINSILDRIQRAAGSSGAMPQGGPKLSQADIDKFIKWNTDGLLEN
jgi:hypothetical protein